jgi:hypothetical protein
MSENSDLWRIFAPKSENVTESEGKYYGEKYHKFLFHHVLIAVTKWRSKK